MSARSNAGVAAFAGAVGGGAAGLIDLLATVRATSQYVPGLGGKLWAAFYATCSSALLGVIVTVLISLGLDLLGALSRGPVWMAALRGRSPARPPLAAWSYAVAAPIMVAAAIPIAARLITPFLNGRRHLGLAVAIALANRVFPVPGGPYSNKWRYGAECFCEFFVDRATSTIRTFNSGSRTTSDNSSSPY